MLPILRRATTAGVTYLTIAAAALAVPLPRDSRAAKDDDSKRPKLTLKATPGVSMSPSRVMLTAELSGGANDYEEFYCATVGWDWGDGTESESTTDCEPYQAGKSEIRRRFTVQHLFRAGVHRIAFRLKRNDKTLAVANVTIQVEPGVQHGR